MVMKQRYRLRPGYAGHTLRPKNKPSRKIVDGDVFEATPEEVKNYVHKLEIVGAIDDPSSALVAVYPEVGDDRLVTGYRVTLKNGDTQVVKSKEQVLDFLDKHFEVDDPTSDASEKAFEDSIT